MNHRKQKTNISKNPAASLRCASPFLKGDIQSVSRRGILSGVKRAFTLVELIVVVTILAILATIGFVSYSSYLTGVRDTNRLAQLVSIHDGLVLYSTSNELPLPDESVEVRADIEVIANQGYAGSNVLETIDFTKGGVDPRDGSYFTYYLTDDRKDFQLLGFLEEEANITAQIIPSPERGGLGRAILNQTQAVDYSTRIPATYGRKLGIITDTANNPIQEVSEITTPGFIDIGAENTDYIAHFTDTLSVTGSGGSLLSAAAVQNSDYIKNDTSLVTYFDFDGGSLYDRSNSQLSATIVGDAKLDEIKGEETAYFPYTGSDYLDLGNPSILSSGLTDFSISVWTKLEVDISSSELTNYHILGNETHELMGFQARIGHSAPRRLEFRTSTLGQSSGTLSTNGEYPNDMKWHHLAFIKDGTSGTIYIDGQEVSGYSSINSMQDYVASTNDFTIGASRAGYDTQNFNGHLDDVRIYDRAINADEVMNLYLKEKKTN